MSKRVGSRKLSKKGARAYFELKFVKELLVMRDFVEYRDYWFAGSHVQQ
jgi:hypothetical protein|tara:strand:- start:4926 stop:5072 length:147 start_codon:yes stop_codon:yes gene_type:complete